MKAFDSEQALNQISEIMQKGSNAGGITNALKAMMEAAQFIQKIHDDAYSEGFQDALEAGKKVDDL